MPLGISPFFFFLVSEVFASGVGNSFNVALVSGMTASDVAPVYVVPTSDVPLVYCMALVYGDAASEAGKAKYNISKSFRCFHFIKISICQKTGIFVIYFCWKCSAKANKENGEEI